MDEESLNVADLSLDDQIEILMEDLPEPIQAFLRGPERDATSTRLSQKYNLHADQAGAFERAYLYMLLGVNSPDEFTQDLKDAGLPPDTIRGLTNDVNEQVFKKLRDQELTPSSTEAAAYTEPQRPVVPVMQVGTPTPPPQVVPELVAPVAPAPEPARVSHLINLIRPENKESSPAQQTVTEPSYQAPYPAPAPAPRPFTPTVEPEMRTMASDMQALQHPEAIHSASQPQNLPEIPSVSTMSAVSAMSTMPNIPHPSQVSAARSFQTASVPYTSVPTASQPASETYSAPKPLTDYSKDPYREPIT